MSINFFKPTSEPMDDSPDEREFVCTCEQPDDQYLMEVDAGSVGFRHAACNKPPDSWADDAFSMQPVAVTLHWTVDRDYWTDEVDAYGDITVNGVSPGSSHQKNATA